MNVQGGVDEAVLDYQGFGLGLLLDNLFSLEGVIEGGFLGRILRQQKTQQMTRPRMRTLLQLQPRSLEPVCSQL